MAVLSTGRHGTKVNLADIGKLDGGQLQKPLN
jgi:hypothetical protein